MPSSPGLVESRAVFAICWTPGWIDGAAAIDVPPAAPAAAANASAAPKPRSTAIRACFGRLG